MEVSIVPRLYEQINERAQLDHLAGLPLLRLHPTNPRGWQFSVKHSFDRVFAFVVVVATAPLMLAIAIAVKLSSPGPILFRQERLGRDGRVFTMYKFRTMRGDPSVDGEADAGWAAARSGSTQNGCAPAGDRITKVGRVLRCSSLDELATAVQRAARRDVDS